MHCFVIITAPDVAAEDESAVLLLDLRVPAICKPFNLKAVFATVADIIAR